MKSSRRFEPESVRKDFPILREMVNNRSLVYFDNGATSQKPQSVIDAISNYYKTTNSNVHRGAHFLSDKATEQFEDSRRQIQAFVNAEHREEILWTRGTTEAINLVAQTWGDINISAGDEIIVSTLEHHSNIVPWQILCEKKNATLRVIQLDENQELDITHYRSLLCDKTKLVAVGHISNALGVINPIEEITRLAHQYNAKVLIDGAQAMAHLVIDVQKLDCDFYAFSGHKMFAPMGIGVLYGKRDLLDAMPPWQAGGEMIEKVSFDKTTFNQLPYKFEAGTPNVAGAIGLSAAVNYLNQWDRDLLLSYENDLQDYAVAKLKEIPGMKIVAEMANRASVISFNIDNCHSQDIGMMLDQQGIAVRTGHHCTMPLMDSLGLTGTIRASLSFYNTKAEIDVMCEALVKAKSMLV